MASSNIVRFDPFEDLTRLQHEMNRLFDDRAYAPARRTNGSAAAGWAPTVDIWEDGNEIVLKAELPGVKPDDIDIQVANETLTVRGEKKFEDEERKEGYVRVERSYGSFQRSFSLGVPVDADKINAAFKDGILTVRLPKSEAIKPKKIAVQAA